MVYCAGELSGLAVGMSGEIAGESVKGDGMVEAGLSVFQAMKKLLPWYSPLAGEISWSKDLPDLPAGLKRSLTALGMQKRKSVLGAGALWLKEPGDY